MYVDTGDDKRLLGRSMLSSCIYYLTYLTYLPYVSFYSNVVSGLQRQTRHHHRRLQAKRHRLRNSLRRSQSRHCYKTPFQPHRVTQQECPSLTISRSSSTTTPPPPPYPQCRPSAPSASLSPSPRRTQARQLQPLPRFRNPRAFPGRAVDIIINNAGAATFQSNASQPALDPVDLDPADLDTLFHPNVRGPRLLIRAALPHLSAPGGCIVNVAV
ncbi:hypothetical protein M8818_002318 [Zalaria obscura]|uniref:Uncharacterized protein n=1 Tax=Zalaria obscura TaxID=2024903 RepID=A0ACC3SI04_9PEZI